MLASITFLALITCLLWVIIGSRGSKKLKTLFIFISVYLCASLGFSLETFKGWPSKSQPVGEFQVHWSVVEEPNKKTGDEGNIYIWLTSNQQAERKGIRKLFIDFRGGNRHQPRAFRVDYNSQLHVQIAEVKKKINAGRVMMMKFNNKTLSFKGHLEENENIKEILFEFYDLPPARHPEKNYREEE